MKSRITMNVTEDGVYELWLNESGRDLLVEELQKLNDRNEHFHLDSYDFGVQLSTQPYRETDKILSTAKVYLRLDKWDEEHFPHVIQDPEQSS